MLFLPVCMVPMLARLAHKHRRSSHARLVSWRVLRVLGTLHDFTQSEHLGFSGSFFPSSSFASDARSNKEFFLFFLPAKTLRASTNYETTKLLKIQPSWLERKKSLLYSLTASRTLHGVSLKHLGAHFTTILGPQQFLASVSAPREGIKNSISIILRLPRF